MKFSTVDEAKKWLRGLPLKKRELEMKSDFYRELVSDSAKMGASGEKHIAHYRAQIDRLHEELADTIRCFEAMMALLTPEEKLILTARYIKGVTWDRIELHVHYSRRQAIRIHQMAIERLVGMEIGGEAAYADRSEKNTAYAGRRQTSGTAVLR